MARRARHLIPAIVAVVLAAVTAAYLRDPAWLLSTTSGIRGWETDERGIKMRWMGGHASFFVPADARSLEIPLRTAFDRPDDWPVSVSVSIDDRPADQLVLADGRWHRIVLVMPPRGTRKVRRIDVRADRTRDDNRGAALGEIQVR
jgi:hypothetical protein